MLRNIYVARRKLNEIFIKYANNSVDKVGMSAGAMMPRHSLSWRLQMIQSLWNIPLDRFQQLGEPTTFVAETHGDHSGQRFLYTWIWEAMKRSNDEIFVNEMANDDDLPG